MCSSDLAVLDEVGDHVDLRMGLMKRLAHRVGGGHVEGTELAAECDEGVVRQVLRRQRQHPMAAQQCLQFRDGIVRRAVQGQVGHLGAEGREMRG